MDEGTDSAADPALLLKVMEVNEKLAETRSLDEVNAVGQEVQGVHRNTVKRAHALLHPHVGLVYLTPYTLFIEILKDSFSFLLFCIKGGGKQKNPIVLWHSCSLKRAYHDAVNTHCLFVSFLLQ